MKVTIPARPALPDAERGLPQEWTKSFIQALEKHAGPADA